MSEHKKQAILNVAHSAVLTLACVFLAWGGKTLVAHGEELAAMHQWKRSQPSEVRSAVLQSEKEITHEMNVRFDEIKRLLMEHMAKNP